MSTTWTEQDEATLRELTERKMRFTDEAKEPLRKLSERMKLVLTYASSSWNPPRDPGWTTYHETADALIKHAAELRDALEPFDLRKPALDPIEAAIQSGSFQFFDWRRASMGKWKVTRDGLGRWSWFNPDGTKLKGFLTEGCMRDLLQRNVWTLAE